MDRQSFVAANMLPSCNDLLNGVQPRSERRPDGPLCWTCPATQRNPVPHHGGRCLSCLEPTVTLRNSYPGYTTVTNESSRHEIDYTTRRSSHVSDEISHYQPTTLTTPVSSTFSQNLSHADSSARTNDNSPYHHPMYLHHPPSPLMNPSQPAYASTSPTSLPEQYATDIRNANQEPSYVPSAVLWISNSSRGRIPSQSTKAAATNARHKDSEKKRRDITVSCVAAIEIFTRDIHPGVAAGCKVCIEDEKARKLLPAFDGLYNVDKSRDADGLLNRMKRPKNDKLEESCMSQYLYVLHHHPEVYPQRVEELVDLMTEQKKEQERGTREAGNSEAKLRKWQGDQRAAQTEKLLRQAKELGRRHGLVMDWETRSAVKKERKRKCDEEHELQHKRHISAPTPPSSVTSPRSRKSSPESGDEGYVVAH